MTRNVTKRVRAWLLGGIAAAAITLSAPLATTAEAQSKDPIRIGFGMALTGGLAAAGKSALIAMQIWAEDVNENGGLLDGRPVELVFYDDQTNPATVPGIYTKLLDVDKVDLVVSGYGTNMIVPAMPIAIQREKVFMSLFGLGANEEFQYDRYFSILPAGPEPKSDWSRGYFDIAKAQGFETVAVIAADAEFAQNAAEGAKKNAEEYGFEIVYDQSYPPATADFTPILRALRQANPDFVYVGSYPPDSAGIVRALNEVGLGDNTKMFGGGMVGVQFASLADSLASKLNGIVNYDFFVKEPTVIFEGVDEFLAKYQPRAKEQGVDPLGHYLPPWAYSYMQVLGEAIKATKSLDDATLAEYIAQNTHETIMGPVTFGANGEWDKTRVLFIQYTGIEDGKAVEQFGKAGYRPILKPEDFATTEWKPYSDVHGM